MAGYTFWETPQVISTGVDDYSEPSETLSARHRSPMRNLCSQKTRTVEELGLPSTLAPHYRKLTKLTTLSMKS